MSPPATALIRAGRAQGAKPHERFLLDPGSWALLPRSLDAEPTLELLALWAEPGIVHAAFRDGRPPGAGEGGAVLLASVPARDNQYPALSPARPGAALFERAVRDLWGLSAEGAADARPWLDHGRWLFEAPLSASPVRRSTSPEGPEVLAGPALPAGARLLLDGPVRGVVAEPVLLRVLADGGTVLRAEARLGYAHRNVVGAMLGKSPRAASVFAARLSGDSTVAHSWAFAAAVEAATGTAPPPRALLLRALMLELERAANHLRDWGRLAGAAGASWLRDRCGTSREALLRACEAAFGHRLMFDRVLPGGIAADATPGGVAAVLAAVDALLAALPALRAAGEPLLEHLAGVGPVPAPLAARFAAGGFVGRASGRSFDARAAAAGAPRGALLPPAVPAPASGDAAARLRVRMAELDKSLELIRHLAARLGAEPGPPSVPLAPRAGEGVGIVEGFRGEALHWVAVDSAGLLRACFPRDAGWLHWPLLEAALAGSPLEDAALVELSFNAPCAGVDL